MWVWGVVILQLYLNPLLFSVLNFPTIQEKFNHFSVRFGISETGIKSFVRHSTMCSHTKTNYFIKF
jgi:hypothetical protein